VTRGALNSSALAFQFGQVIWWWIQQVDSEVTFFLFQQMSAVLLSILMPTRVSLMPMTYSHSNFCFYCSLSWPLGSLHSKAQTRHIQFFNLPAKSHLGKKVAEVSLWWGFRGHLPVPELLSTGAAFQICSVTVYCVDCCKTHAVVDTRRGLVDHHQLRDLPDFELI